MKEVIFGRVGSEEVESHLLPGLDYGLSYYYYRGKTFIGIVAYTEIHSRRYIKY